MAPKRQKQARAEQEDAGDEHGEQESQFWTHYRLELYKRGLANVKTPLQEPGSEKRGIPRTHAKSKGLAKAADTAAGGDGKWVDEHTKRKSAQSQGPSSEEAQAILNERRARDVINGKFDMQDPTVASFWWELLRCFAEYVEMKRAMGQIASSHPLANALYTAIRNGALLPPSVRAPAPLMAPLSFQYPAYQHQYSAQPSQQQLPPAYQPQAVAYHELSTSASPGPSSPAKKKRALGVSDGSGKEMKVCQRRQEDSE
ncbi:unnamed protein product [Sympodiomycopsis kandeliae]